MMWLIKELRQTVFQIIYLGFSVCSYVLVIPDLCAMIHTLPVGVTLLTDFL